MSGHTDVAIVGAGPYGLSLAAHLRAKGVDSRVFGKPMEFWRTQMPQGMQLKSDGFATDLYDPEGQYTLKRYCQERNLEYADRNFPIPLDTFTEYGLAFQERMVPHLEPNMIVNLTKAANGFALRLDNDELVTAKKAVVAAGCSYFQHVPPCLMHLPSEFLTHSSRHHDLANFRGQSVIVVGAGASAIDLAVLLHEAGAEVQLVARTQRLYMHDKGSDTRSLWDQVRRPISGIGPGWRAFILNHAPLLFHALPRNLRLEIVQKMLGPAGGWFMKDRLIGKVPIRLGCSPVSAAVCGQNVRVSVRAHDGSEADMLADHVIAATGYRVDTMRLNFLSEEMRSKVKAVANTPVLSSNLESSISGLYFVGVAAANSFGPVMRFACGARFAARRLTKSLTRSLSKH